MNIKKLLLSKFPKSGIKVYSLNLAWSALLKFSSLGLSLITVAIIARLLGPESFGTLNYIFSLGTIIAVFVSLGIDNTVYKELLEEKHNRNKILGTAIIMKAISGLIALIAITVIVFLTKESWTIQVLTFLFGVGYITQPLNLLYFDFLKERNTRIVAYIQISTSLISSILKISVVYFFHSLPLFILIQSLEALLSGSLSVYYLKKTSETPFKFEFSKEKALSYIAVIAPLSLYGVFTEIYSRIDVLMLKHLQNITTVGLYSTATRLTEVWYMIPNILSSVFFPALANAHNNKIEYFKRLRTLTGILLLSSLIISITTLLFSKQIILLIYGMPFIGGSPLLSIYIFSLPGTFLLTIFYQDLLLEKKVWTITCIAGIPAVLNIILNYALIPSHGAAGAALATVLSYNCITVFFLIYLYNKKLKLNYHEKN